MANPGGSQDFWGIGNLVNQFKGRIREVARQADRALEPIHDQLQTANKAVADFADSDGTNVVKQAEKSAHAAFEKTPLHHNLEQAQSWIHQKQEEVKTHLGQTARQIGRGLEPFHERLAQAQEAIKQGQQRVHDGAREVLQEIGHGLEPGKEQLQQVQKSMQEVHQRIHGAIRSGAEAVGAGLAPLHLPEVDALIRKKAEHAKYYAEVTHIDQVANTVQNADLAASVAKGGFKLFLENPQAREAIRNLAKQPLEDVVKNGMEQNAALRQHAVRYDPGLPPSAAAHSAETPAQATIRARLQEDAPFVQEYSRQHPPVPAMHDKAAEILRGTNAVGDETVCQNATIATYLRLHEQGKPIVTGLPASEGVFASSAKAYPMPLPNYLPSGEHELHNFFRQYTGTHLQEENFQNVREVMGRLERLPDGHSAVLGYAHGDGSGHVILATKAGDHLVLLDGHPERALNVSEIAGKQHYSILEVPPPHGANSVLSEYAKALKSAEQVPPVHGPEFGQGRTPHVGPEHPGPSTGAWGGPASDGPPPPHVSWNFQDPPAGFGMRPQDQLVFAEAAKKEGVWVAVRETNPEAFKYFGDPECVPKPFECKAKSAKEGIYAGLVVDPRRHPDAYPDIMGARRSWKETMGPPRPEGYDVDSEGRLRIHGKLVHADIDVADVIDPKNPSRNLSPVGEEMKNQALPGIRDHVNQQIGAQVIQHSPEAQWTGFSDQKLMMFGPDGKVVVLADKAAAEKFYESEFQGRQPLSVKGDLGKPPEPLQGAGVFRPQIVRDPQAAPSGGPGNQNVVDATARFEARAQAELAEGVKPSSKELKDVRDNFKAPPPWTDGKWEYHQISGELGKPSEVMKHRDINAQNDMSSGTGEHAGHMIGIQFGATGGAENMGLQNPNMNTYSPRWVRDETYAKDGGADYLKMEKDWAEKLEAGWKIHATVVDKYPIGDSRPAYRTVNWTETTPGGVQTSREMIYGNFSSPQMRAAQARSENLPGGDPGVSDKPAPWGQPASGSTGRSDTSAMAIKPPAHEGPRLSGFDTKPRPTPPPAFIETPGGKADMETARRIWQGTDATSGRHPFFSKPLTDNELQREDLRRRDAAQFVTRNQEAAEASQQRMAQARAQEQAREEAAKQKFDRDVEKGREIERKEQEQKAQKQKDQEQEQKAQKQKDQEQEQKAQKQKDQEQEQKAQKQKDQEQEQKAQKQKDQEQEQKAEKQKDQEQEQKAEKQKDQEQEQKAQKQKDQEQEQKAQKEKDQEQEQKAQKQKDQEQEQKAQKQKDQEQEQKAQKQKDQEQEQKAQKQKDQEQEQKAEKQKDQEQEQKAEKQKDQEQEQKAQKQKDQEQEQKAQKEKDQEQEQKAQKQKDQEQEQKAQKQKDQEQEQKAQKQKDQEQDQKAQKQKDQEQEQKAQKQKDQEQEQKAQKQKDQEQEPKAQKEKDQEQEQKAEKQKDQDPEQKAEKQKDQEQEQKAQKQKDQEQDQTAQKRKDQEQEQKAQKQKDEEQEQQAQKQKDQEQEQKAEKQKDHDPEQKAEKQKDQDPDQKAEKQKDQEQEQKAQKQKDQEPEQKAQKPNEHEPEEKAQKPSEPQQEQKAQKPNEPQQEQKAQKPNEQEQEQKAQKSKEQEQEQKAPKLNEQEPEQKAQKPNGQEQEQKAQKLSEQEPEQKAQKPNEQEQEQKGQKPEGQEPDQKALTPNEPEQEQKTQKANEQEPEQKAQKPNEQQPEEKEQKPNEQQQEQKAQKPNEQQPEEKAQKPNEQQTEQKAQKPNEQQPEQKAQKPNEQQPEQKAQKPNEQQSERKAQKPNEQQPEQKAQKPKEQQPEHKAQKPNEQQPERKAQKPNEQQPERKAQKPQGQEQERQAQKPQGQEPGQKAQDPSNQGPEQKAQKQNEQQPEQKAQKSQGQEKERKAQQQNEQEQKAQQQKDQERKTQERKEQEQKAQQQKEQEQKNQGKGQNTPSNPNSKDQKADPNHPEQANGKTSPQRQSAGSAPDRKSATPAQGVPPERKNVPTGQGSPPARGSAAQPQGSPPQRTAGGQPSAPPPRQNADAGQKPPPPRAPTQPSNPAPPSGGSPGRSK